MEATGSSDAEPCCENGPRSTNSSMGAPESSLLLDRQCSGDDSSGGSLRDSPRGGCGLPHSEKEELRSTGDAITWSEFWRFSLVVGCTDMLVDLDKYWVYFLLIQRVGCDFEASYGALYLVYTMAYLVFSPLTGFIADYLQNHTILVMILCSSSTILVYISLLTATLNDVQLIAVYALRCTVQMQMSSSSWKAIKMFVQFKFGTDEVLHEEAMNTMGTHGGLAAGLYEIAFLLLALLSALWKADYAAVRWLMDVGVILTSSVVLLFSISLWGVYGGSSFMLLVIEIEGEEGGGDASCSQCPEHATKVDVQDSDALKCVNDKPIVLTHARNLLGFFTYRVSYLWGSVLVSNCLCLAMVSTCFQYMFDGPITLTRAALSLTKHGLCGGAVDFILLQGLVLQLLYLVGGVAYIAFIMRLHPSQFYGWILPGMSIAFMVACGLQFLPLPEMVAAAIISTATVLSYYMSTYNYYMLSGASKAELFGFVQAVHSAGVGLAGFLPSVLQLEKAGQGTLMVVSLVLATWSLLQSLHLWKQEFSEHPAKGRACSS